MALTARREGVCYHGRLSNARRVPSRLRQPNKLGTCLTSTCDVRSLTSVQVLKSAVERVINTQDDPEPSTEVPLGLYIVRGDNVCTIGLVDEELDASIDWTKVKGEAIGGVKHV